MIGAGLALLLTLPSVANERVSTSINTSVDVSDVDAAVRQAMTRFNIPGLAIAVVEKGKVILAKGYGVRHIETSEPVDKHTLFGIASNTKAFTSAALAMLVDEGKIKWDDKVIKHLPEFRMFDAYVTGEMTIRDLLSHRSGLALGAGDLMIWPDTNKTTQQLIAGIAKLKPSSSFRSEYAYNNLMFVVAGEVVARVSGVSWQDFVEQRMFSKIGMDDSKAGFSRISPTNTNWATGHIPMDGKLNPFFVNYLEDFRGAGAIASNVDDMSQWLITQLNAGKTPQGQQLFSAQQQLQMWQPHIMREPKEESFITHRQQFRGYGLGWAIEDYFGYKKLGHGGGILGMVSRVALLPEKQLGVVLLSNQQASPALTSIVDEVFEGALGLSDEDHVELAAKSYEQEKAQSYASAGLKPLTAVQANLPLDFYTSTLESPWYGDVIVELINGQLTIDFTHTSLLKGKLEHYSGNTFVVRWNERLLEADAYIQFELDNFQRVVGATMEFVNPDITDFSFDFHDLELTASPVVESE
ncbi:serine hydrolase [Pseudoalteromonas byunsanensis]|uniref:Serine hydrolase n=1 Tax=Pseudoalteromonas byunsanensis TaxID=327939 RepID=A0A1S1NFZ3_9GAMM|nr:serine hydrolase [Pseudoalteromonas byunsanensis]OHU97784.1 serine hydrolase [Pseudoalteromonas byunsanensis]